MWYEAAIYARTGEKWSDEVHKMATADMRASVLWRSIPVNAVALTHSIVLLVFYMLFYAEGKDRYPPVFVPSSMIPDWPIPVKIILTWLDVGTYTLIVYGTRGALAALISFMCHILERTIQVKVNSRIEKLIRHDSDEADMNGNNNIVAGGYDDKNTKVQLQQSLHVMSNTKKAEELYAILKSLSQLSIAHQRVVDLFSTQILLLISEDFFVSCVDIATAAATWSTEKAHVRFEIITYLNKFFSLVPLLIIYISAAKLSTMSYETKDLIAKYNLTQEVSRLNGKLFESRAMPVSNANGTLATSNTGDSTDFKRTSSMSSQKSNDGSSRLLDLSVSHHSDLSIRVGGMFNIERDFILNFAAFTATFSVMLIQLIPKRD